VLPPIGEAAVVSWAHVTERVLAGERVSNPVGLSVLLPIGGAAVVGWDYFTKHVQVGEHVANPLGSFRAASDQGERQWSNGTTSLNVFQLGNAFRTCGGTSVLPPFGGIRVVSWG
jgi:hypothetical protein